MRERILLAVDGNSLLHRSFHANAAAAHRDEAGRPIWGVRGLVTQVVAAVERVDPDAVVVGFDDPEHSLRRQRWSHYKATRVDKPETLKEQLLIAAQMLTELGLVVVVPPGLEADDVLASAAATARTQGASAVVVTSDRDSFALIDEHTSVLRVINGGIDASPMITPKRLPMLLGIGCGQYRDFAALRGDASDNLLGVPGFGAKTAAKLLAEFASVAAALADIDAGGERVRRALGPAACRKLSTDEAREAWRNNLAVMAMRDDVPIDVDFERGVGLLPLKDDAVKGVFAQLGLTWSVGKALRVLAGVDEPVPGGGESVADWDASPRPTHGHGKRWAPLPARPVEDEPTRQLALFD